MKTRLVYLQSLRSLVAVCLMLLFVQTMVAQHWALPSSRWQYYISDHEVFGPGSDYFCCEYMVTDTPTLAGHQCYEISNTYYIYESGDTGYIYLNNAFRSIYYFGANQGDTLSFYVDTMTYGAPASWQPYIKGVVDSVIGVSTNGIGMKHFYVSMDLQGNYNYLSHLEYSEKIGMLAGRASDFYPKMRQPSDAPTQVNCNYGDDSIPGFWLNPNNCRTVGVEDLSIDIKISGHPNPSTGTFTIDLPMPGEKLLHIYDIAGREVLNQAVSDQQLTARLTVAGIYMVEVLQGQSRYRSKVVVQ